MDSNGKAHVVSMSLDYDLLTGDMVIGGNVPNINLSLSMLGQAVREFEAIERVHRMQALQQQAQVAAQNQRIADMVTKRG